MEMRYFVSDTDADKRAKVIDWLVADDAAKAALAKKLGVPPGRLKVVRARLSADGRFVELQLAARPVNLAFSPDGRALAATFVRPLHLAADLNGGKPLALDVGYPQQRSATDLLLLSDIHSGGRLQVSDLTDEDKGNRDRVVVNEAYADVALSSSDAEFLKRVVKDTRGGEPTALELKYFAEDKDPKKREKLLDELLKDPAVQKKLGKEWKQKMLKGEGWHVENRLQFNTEFAPRLVAPLMLDGLAPQSLHRFNLNVVPPPTKLEKLVDELLAAKKSDGAVLEGLTLAALGRLPTDAEKKLALPGIAAAKDRKAAWAAVAKSLAGEGAKANDSLWLDVELQSPKPQKPPVPPAKP
jgi:hypothetical protein